MKNSVIIYHDYLETIFSELTDTEIGQLIRALLVFDSTGNITEFEDRTVRTAYKRLINDCEHNKLKYEKTCQRNRENVQKRWEKQKQIPSDTSVYERIRVHTKNTDNDNDNDNVNENDNVNVNVIKPYKNKDGMLFSQQEADNNIQRQMSLLKMQGKI